MNKSNLTRLVIHLLAAAKCAKACGMDVIADYLRGVAEEMKRRYPELFVA